MVEFEATIKTMCIMIVAPLRLWKTA